MRSADFNALQARGQVRLRMRHNLDFTLQTRAGQPCFVAKDPITLKYFFLDERQRFIVGMMDGNHTLEQIRRACEAKYRPLRMSLAEIEDFARSLLESNLALNESPGALERTVAMAERQERRQWWARLNPFYIKIPLANPNRWLAKAQAVGNVVFSRIFVLSSSVLLLAALGLVVTHWHDFLARLPDYADFFSVQTVFLFWLTLGLVRILHELGHAFCCRRLGADVQEMGVLVLFFFPTLYCNVSDAWTLPSKWRRMAVSAAGVYVELVIASAATLLWWCSDAHSLFHHFSFALMTVCSVNTVICNANPLMRFDGYFVLADWLEIPNLAQRAGEEIRRRALGWLGVELGDGDGENTTFLFWFGLASAVYRWHAVGLALYLLAEFLKQQHLGGLAVVLGGIALATFIGVPIYQLLRWLHQLGRLPEVKAMRSWAVVGIAAALLAGFFLVPAPRKVRGVALVQVMPDQVQRVVVPEAEGFLQEIRVRDGQRVQAGEVLAVFVNPKLDIKLKLNQADQSLRHLQQNALLGEQTETASHGTNRPSDWQQCEQELRTLAREHQALQTQAQRLILRAPVAGVVMGLPSLEDQGKWLEKGTEFCRIGNSEALRALVVVDPAEHAEVRTGSPAAIRVHGAGGRQYAGFVTGIAQVEAGKVPAALSCRIAGEVPTQYDAATNSDKPHGQYYLVSVQFSEHDGLVHPGVLGRVKIDADSQTLWWRLRRWLGTTFNWGL